ncbi:MAG: ferrochelatase [Planctomycetes bacterium]|nr:ferrochelatase [Planctomycetota bacterium]
MTQAYDAILIVGFGGPEKRDDVIPFLENVLRGKNVPRERMREVAEHYYQFDGISPINAHVRQLIESLRTELDSKDIPLPIYWGNRNWHPLLADTMQQMADEGIQHALAVVLSAYSSYSSCRQYLENIQTARDAVGKDAPQIDKIRVFYNHPDFIAVNADHLRLALDHFSQQQRKTVHIAYTAHSIPCSMAATCDYEKQLAETCRLVSEALHIPEERWKLVYQSRSGRPSDPWLEPDICDHLTAIHEQGVTNLVILPIGFLSDHLEILYDLDHEARKVCETLGLNMVRAATPGTHPRFLAMLCKLIQERLTDSPSREAIGQCGPHHDICPADCCPAPDRPRP